MCWEIVTDVPNAVLCGVKRILLDAEKLCFASLLCRQATCPNLATLDVALDLVQWVRHRLQVLAKLNLYAYSA